MTTTLNSYRAQVVSNFIQGAVQHTTYVAGRTAEEARRTLEREGFDVLSMEVLVLSDDPARLTPVCYYA